MDYRHSTETTILKIKSQGRWNSKKVTALGTVFLVVVLLIYLMFGLVEVGTVRPTWFKLSTHFFSMIALMGTIALCWRNSNQAHIPSGRKVWKIFSWAAIAILVGEVLGIAWKFYVGASSGISPADFCNVAFYILTIWGLTLVVRQQKIALKRPQMLLVGMVAAVAAAIALQIIMGTSLSVGNSSSVAWVNSISQILQPLVDILGLFYLLSDIVLIVMSAVLFLGFWGGRMGTTWQVMAQGLVCVYLADVRFAFLSKAGAYESGDLLEIFWIAGFVQISIAAALEWENAHRIQRLIHR
jgi:membrane protein CcdC involved in cytochrome C biogenesis